MTDLKNAEKLQPIAPFTARYSPQIPELLLSLNCSIALTTYQAGKVVFVSPNPVGVCIYAHSVAWWKTNTNNITAAWAVDREFCTFPAPVPSTLFSGPGSIQNRSGTCLNALGVLSKSLFNR